MELFELAAWPVMGIVVYAKLPDVFIWFHLPSGKVSSNGVAFEYHLAVSINHVELRYVFIVNCVNIEYTLSFTLVLPAI